MDSLTASAQQPAKLSIKFSNDMIGISSFDIAQNAHLLQSIHSFHHMTTRGKTTAVNMFRDLSKKLCSSTHCMMITSIAQPAGCGHTYASATAILRSPEVQSQRALAWRRSSKLAAEVQRHDLVGGADEPAANQDGGHGQVPSDHAGERHIDVHPAGVLSSSCTTQLTTSSVKSVFTAWHMQQLLALKPPRAATPSSPPCPPLLIKRIGG